MQKTALITGGSSGLGLAMARELVQHGYRLILLSRNRERLDSAVKSIQGMGGAAEGFSCDVTDDIGLRDIRRKVEDRFGLLDFLMLNAGVVSPGLLEDFGEISELKKDLEINLWGTILSAYVFLPLLAQDSRVLMISSGFGLLGPAGYSVYAASKAGMINFAESLRRELLHRDISVHVACPADMQTPQYEQELRDMPGWMGQPGPRGLLSPEAAAKRILQKCDKGKFLIVINPLVHLLLIMDRVLPRSLKDRILDRILPLPGKV